MTETAERAASHREAGASPPLLTVEDLQVHFFTDSGVVRAVDGVDLLVPRGRTVCLVGESGSGKSITAMAILQLIQPPGQIVGGHITLDDREKQWELTALGPHSRAIRGIRGNKIAMIFQDPMTCLSPVHTVGNQIMEAIRLHIPVGRAEARDRAIEMMRKVGIPDAARRFDQYPHEMSGGLRQRVMISMALVCEPVLLIADEPTTALDVTIQAQILELIQSLQDEMHMAVLLITHDLGVVAEVADEVAVMYMGRIMERAPVQELFHRPVHPYTQALIRSMPAMNSRRKQPLATIRGSVPEPLATIPGCAFHPRCEHAQPGRCDIGQRPELVSHNGVHVHACRIAHQDGTVHAAADEGAEQDD